MATIAPGAFKQAAAQRFPELVANLSEGSAWMELIQADDDPARSNSPYYGPATQFLVDCFLDIAATTPALSEAAPTPLARFRSADYVIHKYIGNFAVGSRGLITEAYERSDIAQTNVHMQRRHHLIHDRSHVLLGASVPFDDVARVAGGAALKLQAEGVAETEIADVVAGSNRLQIVGGVHGDKTVKITDRLGHNYLDPKYFLRKENGAVEFSQAALEVIKSLLSPHGCPTAKIEDGPNNLFTRYWKEITRYVLAGVSYEYMQTELGAQLNITTASTIIVPASQIGSVPPKVPQKQNQRRKKPKRKR